MQEARNRFDALVGHERMEQVIDTMVALADGLDNEEQVQYVFRKTAYLSVHQRSFLSTRRTDGRTQAIELLFLLTRLLPSHNHHFDEVGKRTVFT